MRVCVCFGKLFRLNFFLEKSYCRDAPSLYKKPISSIFGRKTILEYIRNLSNLERQRRVSLFSFKELYCTGQTKTHILV